MEDCAGIARGRIGRATTRPRRGLHAARLFASSPCFNPAAFLIFTTCLLAGEQPQGADGFAPPERFSAEQRGHWAYQPVKRLEPQGGQRIELGAQPDRSIHPRRARRPGSGTFAAGKPVALIRRVTFDLAGRPPTTDEVAAFLGDQRPDAYERLVDRLLASPEYGVALGAALARPGALRRHQWLRARRRTARRLAVSRLDRSLAERGSCLTIDSSCFRLAGDDLKPGDHDALDRHRLLPLWAARGGGRQCDPGGEAAERAVRDHRHRRLGLSGPDDRLCPLPRSQVRRDPHDRLLPASGVLRDL